MNMNISHLIGTTLFLITFSASADYSNLTIYESSLANDNSLTLGGLTNTHRSVELEYGGSVFGTGNQTIVPLTEDGMTVPDFDELSIARSGMMRRALCQMFAFYNKALGQVDFVFNPNNPNCAHLHPG